jgi:hypothetical protein
LVERVRNIRKRLVRLQSKTGSGETSVDEINRAKLQAGPASEITKKLGTEMEKREFAALTRELEQAGRVAAMPEALVALRTRWLHSEFAFGSIRPRHGKRHSRLSRSPGRRFVSQEAAQEWLELGKQAASRGDALSLQEAVRRLWKLRPKSDPISENERAQESILTKN